MQLELLEEALLELRGDLEKNSLSFSLVYLMEPLVLNEPKKQNLMYLNSDVRYVSI